MRTYKMILICVLATLSLAGAFGVQAQEESTWQPAPLTAIDPAPWRRDFSVGIASEEIAFLELPVVADSFMLMYRRSDNFGHEESVWFGTHPTLGPARAFLRWQLRPLPGTYVGAAVYLPIVGTNEPRAMTGYAHRMTMPWNEDSVPIHDAEPTPFASFTVPAEPGWVYFDVSNEISPLRLYYGTFDIQLRGPENEQTTLKGMFSREAEPGSPVATLVIAYRPDREAPRCSINPLPPLSAASFYLFVDCADSPNNASGIRSVEIHKRANDGPWELIQTLPPGARSVWVEKLRGGVKYAFRAIAEDEAGNRSTWTNDNAVVTTIETIPPVILPGPGFNVPCTTPQDSWYWSSNAIVMTDPEPSSGASTGDLLYLDESVGIWQRHTESNPIPWQVGRRYRFMAQAIDGAGNLSNWFSFGPVTVADRFVNGEIADAYGAGLEALPLVITPTPCNPSVVTWGGGGFRTWVIGSHALTIAPLATQFILFPATTVPGTSGNIYHWSSNLYAKRNIVVNGSFDTQIGSVWEVTGPVVVAQAPFDWPGGQSLRFGESVARTSATLRQSLHIPADMYWPTLSWWGQPYETTYHENPAQFRVIVTDSEGVDETVAETKITAWYAPHIAPQAVDLRRWTGKRITLTFAFDPGSSTTAGYWLDEVRISPLPQSIGLSLEAVPTRPVANSVVTLNLKITNHRWNYAEVPIEVLWPDHWRFIGASETTTELVEGKATFAVTVHHTRLITLQLWASDTEAKVAAQISARLLDPIIASDYTPADNRATLTVIVDGHPTWLPVIAR